MAQITATPCAEQRLGRTAIPLPPKNLREDGFSPMWAWELDLILASYNDWTEDWNAYEGSGRTKLNCPRWTFVKSVGWSHGPPNLVWITLRSGRRGVICVRDWWKFHDGLSCCVNPIPFENVEWAGWEIRTPEIVDDHDADLAHLLEEAAVSWKIRNIANSARKRPRRVMMLPAWAEASR